MTVDSDEEIAIIDDGDHDGPVDTAMATVETIPEGRDAIEATMVKLEKCIADSRMYHVDTKALSDYLGLLDFIRSTYSSYRVTASDR